MPEVQKTTALGEMTQRFIEFVMMQAQQAALFLGRIPNPQTGKPEVNLPVARMFIDQLEMVREKTRGNLSAEETEILTRVLADLQLAFVQASGGESAPELDEVEASEPAAPEAPAAPQTPAAEPKAEAPAPAAPTQEESKKKFTKSYGS